MNNNSGVYFILSIMVLVVMGILTSLTETPYEKCPKGSAVVDPITSEVVYIQKVDYWGRVTLRTTTHQTFNDHCNDVQNWRRP